MEGKGGAAAARQALREGGRLLTGLFTSASGRSSAPGTKPAGGGGDDDDDAEDVLGSSQQAQSHARALERFLAHVNAAMAPPPTTATDHRATLSSSTLSLSDSIASVDDQDDDNNEDEENEENSNDDNDNAPEQAAAELELRPSFQAVPLRVVLQHAEASLALVDRIAGYVDERWRMEARYARERSRLKLQLLQDHHQQQQQPGPPSATSSSGSSDSLEALAEALALFQEVEATQVAETVAEVDQQVRQPLLQLRDQLKHTVHGARAEQRSLAREVEGLETRLAKSKAGLARLHERGDELRHRIEQYRRALRQQQQQRQPPQQQQPQQLPQQPPNRPGWEEYPADSLDPARVSGVEAPAEAHIIPSLERRLREVEGEARASAREIAAQGAMLLEALGRQDRQAGRWAQELQRADTAWRVGLQGAATAYVEAGARATQRSLFQLESLMQLAARVDLEEDQQAFIARYRDGAGTAPRAPALRLVVDQAEWRRRSSSSSSKRRQGKGQGQGPLGDEGGDGDGDGEGQWEEVEVELDAAPSPTAAAAAAEGREMATIRDKSPPPRSSSSPSSSPGRGTSSSPSRRARVAGALGAAEAEKDDKDDKDDDDDEDEEEAVVPSFDEKEDGAVVAAFVEQLFSSVQAPPPPAPSPSPSPSAPPSASRPGTEERDGSFDWSGFPQALALVQTASFHSTESERRRFFARAFGGEDGRGRAAFLAALNLQRSKGTDVGAGFDELARLLWAFLRRAQRHRDVHAAKMAMMLASTFHHTTTRRASPPSSPAPPTPIPSPPPQQPPPAASAPAGTREFLSRRLQQHPLWKDAAFWTRALQDQIREQLASTGELLPFGTAAWHDASGEARVDLVSRVRNVVFSNTAALAHSMLEMGAPGEDAREFVLRVVEQHGLPEEMCHLLLGHLAKRRARAGRRQRRRQRGERKHID